MAFSMQRSARHSISLSVIPSVRSAHCTPNAVFARQVRTNMCCLTWIQYFAHAAGLSTVSLQARQVSRAAALVHVFMWDATSITAAIAASAATPWPEHSIGYAFLLSQLLGRFWLQIAH